MIDSCEHEDGYASDNKLRDIKHKDIGKLLNENPDIDKLVYTSEYVKREMNQIFKSYHKISKNDKKLQYLKLSNKQYEVRILYSPSPQALINMGRGGAEKRDNQYRKFLK